MKNLIALLNASLAFTVCLLPYFANAKPQLDDCKFLSRQSAQEFFSALPKEVVGSVTCESAKDASSLNVLHINGLTEKKLEQAVTEIGKIEHPMNETAQVTWVSKQALEKRQLIVATSVAKTDHSIAQKMLHYAFVIQESDGSSLIFVHSAPEKETHALRLTLDLMNREFRSASFLAKIHE